jgi:hypothetical protein
MVSGSFTAQPPRISPVPSDPPAAARQGRRRCAHRKLQRALIIKVFDAPGKGSRARRALDCPSATCRQQPTIYLGWRPVEAWHGLRKRPMRVCVVPCKCRELLPVCCSLFEGRVLLGPFHHRVLDAHFRRSTLHLGVELTWLRPGRIDFLKI